MPDLRSEFADHYRAHFDFAWRNLRRLGVPSTELDDAAQEVFVVLLRRHESIPPELPLRAWLFGVIRRIAWRYRRSDVRRSVLRDAIDRETNHGPAEYVVSRPDQLHDAQEAARLIERFLDELTPIQAEVFVLAELEELSGKEIAEHLGVNQNTVWSRLRLARRAFDRRFAPIRAESRRLYQRSSTKDPRHPVLSLSRRGHRPSSEDRRRVGALLGIPGFGVGAGEAGASSSPQGPQTAAPMMTTATGAPLAGFLGAAAIAALVAGLGLADRSATAVTSERIEDLASPRRVDEAPADDPGPVAPAEAADSRVLEPQRPLPSPPVAAVRSAKRLPTGPSASALDKRSATPPGTEPPSSPASDDGSPLPKSDLGTEYDLLTRARQALTRGDSRRCLALTETHRHDHPDGILTDERDGLQITALCQLGRPAEAHRLAKTLATRLEDPEAIRRFTAPCDHPGP